MPQGRGLARVLVQRASTITLDWDVRQKSRFKAEDSAGRAVGVFLPRGTVVRGGDVHLDRTVAFELEDGGGRADGQALADLAVRDVPLGRGLLAAGLRRLQVA